MPDQTNHTPELGVSASGSRCESNVFDCCPSIERDTANLDACLTEAFPESEGTPVGAVIDAAAIGSVLDAGTTAFLGLHDRVEQARTNGLYLAVDPDITRTGDAND